ncbi:MAG: hypothetical protein JWR08_788 [Enterovirga sp.]|nr:hypothetical protein [Enterovirga sp.]
MNDIVRKVVPVAELPKELRSDFDPTASVEITGPSTGRKRRSIFEILEDAARLRKSGAIKPVTSEEAVRRIRALRDE